MNLEVQEAIAKPRQAERRNPGGSMDIGLLSRRRDCGAPSFAIASQDSGLKRSSSGRGEIPLRSWIGRLLLSLALCPWNFAIGAEVAFSRIVHGWTNYSTGFSATFDTDEDAGDGATIASFYAPARYESLREYAVIVVWLGEAGQRLRWEEFRYRVCVWSGLAAFTNSPATGDVATVHFIAPTGGSTSERDATTRGGRPAYELRFSLGPAGIALAPGRDYLIGFAASTFVEDFGELYVPTAPTFGITDVQAGDRVPRGWQYLTNAGGLTVYSGQLATELLVEPLPQLRIVRASPDTVTVTWPAALIDYVIEGAPTPADSLWLPVNGLAIRQPGWQGLAIHSPAAATFFRLRRTTP
jgi:hypothetical protein